MSTTKEPTTSAPVPSRSALLAGLVFLVALNLRPSLTAVGPLLPQIGADRGLGETGQGLLGAIPLLAFAFVSPFVHLLSRRIGLERAVLVSLLVLAVGTAGRSYTGSAGLWIGTAVIGSAIAVGNVLVPAIVKRDYSGAVSRATSVYTAFLATAAGTASLVAVPVANVVDWRASLALWGLLALVVAVAWLPRTRAVPGVSGVSGASAGPESLDVDLPPQPPHPSVWRQPTAWLVTAFMGLQSSTFYILVTWLPSIEQADGVPAGQTGVHLFVFQVLGVVGGLAIPRLMRRPETQRAAAATASTLVMVAVLGLLLAPAVSLLWIVVLGLGSGATLVVALSIISFRGRTEHETTQLSGMAQSVGYLVAAAGPVLVGTLAERTGSWTPALALVVGITTLQLLVGVAVSRAQLAPLDRGSSSSLV